MLRIVGSQAVLGKLTCAERPCKAAANIALGRELDKPCAGYRQRGKVHSGHLWEWEEGKSQAETNVLVAFPTA